jgi:hypothetical protein
MITRRPWLPVPCDDCAISGREGHLASPSAFRPSALILRGWLIKVWRGLPLPLWGGPGWGCRRLTFIGYRSHPHLPLLPTRGRRVRLRSPDQIRASPRLVGEEGYTRFMDQTPRRQAVPSRRRVQGSLDPPSRRSLTAAPQDEDGARTDSEHFTAMRIRAAVEQAAEPKNGDEPTQRNNSSRPKVTKKHGLVLRSLRFPVDRSLGVHCSSTREGGF